MSQSVSTGNGIAVQPTGDVMSQTNMSCGRTVLILRDTNGERLEVHAPDGALELEMEFTERGPVAKIRTVALQVDTGDVSVKCRRFDLNAEEDVHITGKEFRTDTEKDIVMNGAFIRLNCDDNPPPSV